MIHTCSAPTKCGEPCKKKVPFQGIRCHHHIGDIVGECSICMESIKKTDKRSLKCHHVFHEQCIHKWLSMKRMDGCKQCPNCRADVTDRKTLNWLEEFRQREKDEDWLPEKEVRVPRRRRRRLRRRRVVRESYPSFFERVYHHLTTYLT